MPAPCRKGGGNTDAGALSSSSRATRAALASIVRLCVNGELRANDLRSRRGQATQIVVRKARLEVDPGTTSAPTGTLGVVPTDDLATIAEWIGDAGIVVALCGAGISTPSGIRDFRGPNGLWTKNPDAEKAAQLDVYLNDPELRKRAWQNRLSSEMWDAKPNPAHDALVALEHMGKLHGLVTQNVDGLHHAAGQRADIVVEIHGNVREAKCVDCGWHGPMEETLDRVRAGEDDPECNECGGILKSATISFGENLVAADLRRAQIAAARADLLLAIGTSLVVYPAAALPEITLQNGGRLVIMNAEPTPYDDRAAAVVRDPLETALPELVALV
jgi:NAD-dependent deacetylase